MPEREGDSVENDADRVLGGGQRGAHRVPRFLTYTWAVVSHCSAEGPRAVCGPQRHSWSRRVATCDALNRQPTLDWLTAPAILAAATLTVRASLPCRFRPVRSC